MFTDVSKNNSSKVSFHIGFIGYFQLAKALPYLYQGLSRFSQFFKDIFGNLW